MRRARIRVIAIAVVLAAASVVGLSGCTPAPAPAEVKAAPKLSAWADRVYGSFKPVTISGSKTEDVAIPDGVSAAVLTLSSEADGPFTLSPVSQVEADLIATKAPMLGEKAEKPLAAGTVIPSIAGDLSGLTAGVISGLWGVDVSDQAPAVRFHLTAPAKWTLTISPVSSLPALGEGGTGDGTYLYGGPITAITFAHEGDQPFAVTEYSADLVQHLVADTESTPKTVNVNAGPTVITVQSAGPWTSKRG